MYRSIALTFLFSLPLIAQLDRATLTGTVTNTAGHSGTIGATGGGTVTLQSGAVFNNAGSLTAYNGSIWSGGGSGILFNNTGTFIVADTSSTFNVFTPFANTGTVAVQTGTLHPAQHGGTLSQTSAQHRRKLVGGVVADQRVSKIEENRTNRHVASSAA